MCFSVSSAFPASRMLSQSQPCARHFEVIRTADAISQSDAIMACCRASCSHHLIDVWHLLEDTQSVSRDAESHIGVTIGILHPRSIYICPLVVTGMLCCFLCSVPQPASVTATPACATPTTASASAPPRASKETAATCEFNSSPSALTPPSHTPPSSPRGQ